MRRLEWKVQAENDRFDILDYIGQDNPDAALELVRKIRAKADGLRTRPTLYRAGRMRGTREMIVHRNYILFYSVTDEAVTILRVKHSRQCGPDAFTVSPLLSSLSQLVQALTIHLPVGACVEQPSIGLTTICIPRCQSASMNCSSPRFPTGARSGYGNTSSALGSCLDLGT